MEKVQQKAIIVSAPSGSGKTTLVKAVMNAIPELEFSISATTRAPRGKEKDGVDYHFLSSEDFKNLIKNDGLVEWEEVYTDQFYGTMRSELERIWKQGKTVVFDVDVVGGVNLKRIFGPQALSIFIQAPSVEELERRLRNRQTDSDEAIVKRLAKATQELGYRDQFDVCIVNDELETASAEMLAHCKNFVNK